MLASNARWWNGDDSARVLPSPIDLRKDPMAPILKEINQKVVVQRYGKATTFQEPTFTPSSISIAQTSDGRLYNDFTQMQPFNCDVVTQYRRVNRAFCQMWIPSSVLLKLLVEALENWGMMTLVSALDPTLIYALRDNPGFVSEEIRDSLVGGALEILQATGTLPSKLPLSAIIPFGSVDLSEEPKIAPTHVEFIQKDFQPLEECTSVAVKPVFQFTPEKIVEQAFSWEACNESDEVLHWCLVFDRRLANPRSSDEANQQLVDQINSEFFQTLKNLVE